MDDTIKSNLITILDKAIHDGDTVARLEEIDIHYLIQCLRVGINASWDKFRNEGKEPDQFVKMIGKVIELQSILHGDKKPDE